MDKFIPDPKFFGLFKRIKRTEFGIQSFDDNTARHDNSLAKIFKYNELKINALQQKGAGIFWSINPMMYHDQRKVTYLKEWSAVGFDLDVAKAKDQLSTKEIEKRKETAKKWLGSLKFPPTAITETKHGFYPFWLFTPRPLEITDDKNNAAKDYRQIIAGFKKKTKEYFGNESPYKVEAPDIVRATRLPGSFHLKDFNHPYRIKFSVHTNKLVNFDDFFAEYYLGPEPWTLTSYKWDGWSSDKNSIYEFPLREALAKISDTELVGFEKFKFTKENTNKTINIIVDGKVTGQFINLKNNTIGSSGGDASVNIVDWCEWYNPGTDKSEIRDKLDKVLKNEYVPPGQNPPSPTEKIRFNQIVETVNATWHKPDIDALKVVLATICAWRFETDPLWMFLIAPPSSLKTELIVMLNNVLDVYPLSSLTPQTLASGAIVRPTKKNPNPPDPSLLARIGSKVITFKDFTTLLTGRWEDLNKILGQLREVYDGQFHAEYGTGAKVNWEGKLGFLAGCTEAIDEFASVRSNLGERFLQYRLEGFDHLAVAKLAMKNLGTENGKRNDLKKIIADFLACLPQTPRVENITASEDIIDRLAHLAVFCVNTRSGTFRESRTKEITLIPEPEGPARLAKQLLLLGKSLALIEERTEINFDDLRVIAKCALGSIPKPRLLIFDYVLGQDKAVSTSQVGKDTTYSRNGAVRYLEDLTAFNILEKTEEKQGGKVTHLWGVTNFAKENLKKALSGIDGLDKFASNISKTVCHYNTGNYSDNDVSNLNAASNDKKNIINNNNNDGTTSSCYSDIPSQVQNESYREILTEE